MAKLLDFTISLSIAALMWLCLFPLAGATLPMPSATSLIVTTVLYGVLTGLLLQLRRPAGFAVLRGANVWVIIGGLFVINVLVPFAAVELGGLGLLLPGVTIESHYAVVVVILFGVVVHWFIDQAFSPVQNRLDKVAMLKLYTARVTTDGVFRAAVRNGELVNTARLLIPRERLAIVGVDLGMATSSISRGQHEHADRIVMEAIPELKECGFLGVLRLSAAYRVLQQSHAALGNDVQVAECQTRIDWLSAFYESGAAFA